MSDHVFRLYERAFEAARDNVHTSFSVYSAPGDYEFTSEGLRLADLLGLLSVDGDEPPVVLDVGAGKGNFLAALKSKREAIRAIGLTVLAHRDQSDGISWVYGDLLRPDTWRPNGVLSEGTVDLSVSKLTYHWLADPIKGLQINHALLRPGGHMFVDRVTAYLDPRTSKAATEMIMDELGRSAGEYGGGQCHLSTTERSLHTLAIDNVHLRGGSPLNLEGIQLAENGLLGLSQA